MSGTVKTMAPSAGLAHIFFECAIIQSLRRLYRFAAIVAAIFIFAALLIAGAGASMRDMGPPLFGCALSPISAQGIEDINMYSLEDVKTGSTDR